MWSAREPTRRLVPRLLLGVAWLYCATPNHAAGDAIVRTQAMLASTIAEYHIEEERIRLEIEIGLVDVEAFANLLPDDLYQKLGHPPRAAAERLIDFCRQDLVIRADGGEALLGRITRLAPRARIRRDEVSGEPLPAAPDEAPEVVIHAVIEYPLREPPRRLILHGLSQRRAPGVGFVVYHEGVAVNDFRYLTATQTLALRWDDPWYSAFEARSLRRSYFAPMSGFLYVEPYEVRKEIIARPLDLQRWVDLGLEGRRTIPVEIQPELLRRAGAFLRERHEVLIDGRQIAPELARIHFLDRTLRSSSVVDPPRELDTVAAVLGAIFVYPTDGLPQRVTMEWDLFDELVQQVSAAAVDQAGPLPTLLEPEHAVLDWQNFLKRPELPTLVDVRLPPNRLERLLADGRWLVAPACLLLAAWLLVRRRGVARFVAPVLIVAGVGAFWAGARAGVSDERAGEVVEGLLHNVYRALDQRGEERIYDALERSVSGELLERIYLETRRGLELTSQGGARARVKAVELLELSAREAEGGAFVARASWTVRGSVGHWGHVHQRGNRYRAELEVGPRGGRWKLVGFEILEEQRL